MGRVAGLISPAFFDLLVVSIRSGTKRLRALVVSLEGGFWGVVEAVDWGIGDLLSRLVLKLLSTGVGSACFFPAPSFVASTLLLLMVVSTGSGANRRTFLVVSSTGMAWKRLGAGGGDVSGMMRVELAVSDKNQNPRIS